MYSVYLLANLLKRSSLLVGCVSTPQMGLSVCFWTAAEQELCLVGILLLVLIVVVLIPVRARSGKEIR